ncbi:MAG: prephenate dehydratase [Flavobacteriaceae bacterium]
MTYKIAIQGIESSFHHLAATKLFDSHHLELLKCDSFENVANSLSSFKADYGVLAIENTIAGSILPNYNLIDSANLMILDEVYLNIQMHLMVLEGQSIHDVKEVHSHPVALLQCKDYLRKFPPQFKVVEGKDTASEAKRIKEQGLQGVAAIAGEQVAKEFGLKILNRNIQSMKNNKTRFVLVGRKNEVKIPVVNKATLKFELDHQVGSLSNVLQLFNTFHINLTKIQSLPVFDSPWQYAFFIDVVFDDYVLFSEVVTMLKKIVKHFKVLGEYRTNKDNCKTEVIKNLENNLQIN